MRLLFVADLHYTLKQFDWLAAQARTHDAVIIGGDLLDLSSALEIEVQIVVVEKYLARLGAVVPVLVCSGNHDGDRRTADNESVAQWLQEIRSAQVLVDGDRLERGGTVITLCPWWDGPVTRAEVEQLLARDSARSKSRWIWIHHAPPDRSPVSWTGRKFGGDEFLVEWIRRYQPDLVFSGHIHDAPFYPEGSWIDRVGRTWVFNPGRQIGPCPTHISFNLAAMTAEWTSFEGQAFRTLGAVEANGSGPAVDGAGASPERRPPC